MFQTRSKRYRKNYMDNLKGLYGSEIEESVIIKKPKKKKKRKPVLIASEKNEQIKLAAWLDKNNILFYHIPNGGRRNLWEGLKFKRMGVKPGVPDICIPLARKSYHGLYIELKRESSSNTSNHQKYWLDRLKQEGYETNVCHGFEEAKAFIEQYLYN